LFVLVIIESKKRRLENEFNRMYEFNFWKSELFFYQGPFFIYDINNKFN